MKRSEAIAAGLKFYETGKPCKKGHISKRYVQGQCVMCAIEHGAKWRKENPEKYSEICKNYVLKNKEKHMKRVMDWRKNNSEKVKEITKKYIDRNPEKVKLRAKKYRQKNIEKFRALDMKKIASKLKRVPKWLTDDDYFVINEIYHLAKIRSEMTGIKWEVDHVIPIRGDTVSGLHVPFNLNVIPMKQNRQKRNKYLA